MQIKKVRGRLYVSCHCTFSDDLSLARVHDIQTELEIRFQAGRAGTFPGADSSRAQHRQSQVELIEFDLMTEAKTTWIEKQRFNGVADSGHTIVVDGDKAAGNSPMELVLIGLCGCTGYDVVSILQKKREPFTSLEVRAAGRARRRPTLGLHGNQADLPRRW